MKNRLFDSKFGSILLAVSCLVLAIIFWFITKCGLIGESIAYSLF